MFSFRFDLCFREDFFFSFGKNVVVAVYHNDILNIE